MRSLTLWRTLLGVDKTVVEDNAVDSIEPFPGGLRALLSEPGLSVDASAQRHGLRADNSLLF